MKYKIYGDYGYMSEVLLHETDTRSDAIRWADRYVNSAGGDFGGYNVIEVAYFAPDGEYTVVMKYRAADFDDDGWSDELEEKYLYDEF